MLHSISNNYIFYNNIFHCSQNFSSGAGSLKLRFITWVLKSVLNLMVTVQQLCRESLQSAGFCWEKLMSVKKFDERLCLVTTVRQSLSVSRATYCNSTTIKARKFDLYINVPRLEFLIIQEMGEWGMRGKR